MTSFPFGGERGDGCRLQKDGMPSQQTATEEAAYIRLCSTFESVFFIRQTAANRRAFAPRLCSDSRLAPSQLNDRQTL